MTWVIQGYRRRGRSPLVEWIDLPEWIPDELVARGVGATGDVRSGAWPVSETLASDLEAAVGRKLFRRRRFIGNLDYFVEYAADN